MTKKELLKAILNELQTLVQLTREAVDRQEIMYAAHENQCELQRRVDDTIIKFRKEKEDE
jgi:hypothetical protein